MGDTYDDLEDFVLGLRDHDEYSFPHEIGHPQYMKDDEDCSLSRIAVNLELEFLRVLREYRIPQFTGVESWTDPRVYPKVVESIMSMVGDDEVNTTNSLGYAILCVIAGPLLSRIKISWTDVQFNKNYYNYAEGWILLPPSMDSSFEAVNKYARNTGVPFVLDPIKFKNLSAVRKQSDMEVDLPSKFGSLAKTASWTDPDWFTWDMHQFAMLLGLEVFDFVKSKLYPFLFPWEGGCGGAPPWNNLFTAAGFIFRYRRGKAARGILGVMSDANQLHTGQIAPKDALFAKGLSLALSGDSRWINIRSELERRRKDAADIGLPYQETIIEVADRTIPPGLSARGHVVNPGDALTGVALSYLRDKGYIVTELDLVTKIEERKRLEAIWGHVPLREIADQIEIRKQEYKDVFLETLTNYVKSMPYDPGVYATWSEMENPFSPSSIVTLLQYYKMRVEQSSHFTSFIFNEQVRCFKQSDVEEFFAKGLETIRDGFCESVGSRYRPDWRRAYQLPADDRAYTEIEQWLASGSLDDLLSGPIPPTIGPDDAGITRDAVLATECDTQAGASGMFILIVSSDKRMIHSVQLILEHQFPRTRFRVVGLNVIEFISYSVQAVRPVRQDPNAMRWLRDMKVYNPYTQQDHAPMGSLMQALKLEAFHLHACREVGVRVFYDYPNINRNLKRFEVEDNRVVVEYAGGFLTRARMRADKTLPTLELARIRQVEDFRYGFRRTVAPIGRRNVRLFSAKRAREFERAM